MRITPLSGAGNYELSRRVLAAAGVELDAPPRADAFAAWWATTPDARAMVRAFVCADDFHATKALAGLAVRALGRVPAADRATRRAIRVCDDFLVEVDALRPHAAAARAAAAAAEGDPAAALLARAVHHVCRAQMAGWLASYVDTRRTRIALEEATAAVDLMADAVATARHAAATPAWTAARAAALGEFAAVLRELAPRAPALVA